MTSSGGNQTSSAGSQTSSSGDANARSADEPPPRFASFAEASDWFAAGGELEPLEQRRARFTRGRAQFLSFQAPISAPDALALIETIRDELSEIDGISPLPDEHLHISIRGAGFQVLRKRRADEIRREDVGNMGERAARTLRGVKPIAAALGPASVFPDALILEVHDDGRLDGIRRMLGESLAGDDTLIDDAHFLPHVTVATLDSSGAARPLRERLPLLRAMPPLAATLRRIDFARWWFTGVDDRESTELEIVRSYILR